MMATGHDRLVPERGRLAQLVRAPALQAGSRGFESLTAHHRPSFYSGIFLRIQQVFKSALRYFVSDVEQYRKMLAVALEEARHGLTEGGIPIGAALFTREGQFLSRGHNRRVQQGDPSIHAETDAFRRAGRLRSYRNLVMVTTLAPCWYCSGLVRQFRIGTVVVGESRTFAGGLDWLRENGVEIVDLDSSECRELLEGYIAKHPEIWNEDIGEE